MPAGSKPGERRGGRKPGTPNKRTADLQAQSQASAAKVEAALGEPFTGDAHAFLMAIYKDPDQETKLRVEAAKKAIEFEKPALTRVDLNSKNEHVVHRVGAEPMSADEWEAEFTTAH